MLLQVIIASFILAFGATWVLGTFFLPKLKKQQLHNLLHTACGAFWDAKLRDVHDNKLLSDRLVTFITGFTCSLVASGYNAQMVQELTEEYVKELLTTIK